MNERARAVTLATWALDDASRDPDSDLSILARQFLRAIDTRKAESPASLRVAVESAIRLAEPIEHSVDVERRRQRRDRGC